MRDTKLYSAVKGLNGFELNRLHRFILSPYFNQNERIIRLFEWVKFDLKNPETPAISKEQLWNLIFSLEEGFDDGRFRKLQSDCLKLIESFYAQEAFESQPIQKAKYLLESIIDNDLDELQSSAIKSTQNILDKETKRSSSYYYYRYEYERSLYKFHLKYSERSAKNNIENLALNLDRFYLGEKLKYYSTILMDKDNVALEYELLFIQEILDHIEKHDYQDAPSIIIYYQIILAYTEPTNKTHYDKLKTLIDKFVELFPPSEAKEIVEAALNYCNTRINAGVKEFVRESFNLYRASLINGVLLSKGYITPWSFKNIVTAGLRLSEFDWVEEFIYTYSEKLEARFKENAISFNLAQLYFYKKQYEKVISQLSKVDYEDLTYALNSKTLLMASYYELEEFEALNSLLDTFRIYLGRNQKVPSNRKGHYLAMINAVKKLSRIRHGDLKHIEKLSQYVRQTDGIVSKNWILEKLESLRPLGQVGSPT